jgi:hypothetical protein
MEGGRIKAKAFKAKAFKAKAFQAKAFKAQALAIEVWPAKRMTIDMATCSRKKTLRTRQTPARWVLRRRTSASKIHISQFDPRRA